MNIVLYTVPTIEPIDLMALKGHLRIELDQTAEDETLEGWIQTAREHVETITRRQLLTATWDLSLDEFPDKDFIVLPFGNLQDVAPTQYVKYKDSDETVTTMTVNTDYIWETNGDGFGRIVLPYGDSWPSFTPWPSNPISIRFVCGWTSAALVPSKIKSAIKLICGDLYENREATLTQAQGNIMDNKTVDRLLWPCRLWGAF